MKNLIERINAILKHAETVKHYARLVIHVIDMLDGVQDWKKENPIGGKPEQTKK